jgi:acyl-CoA reductase-like NAD-dependent aldehyde dehydrogenase
MSITAYLVCGRRTSKSSAPDGIIDVCHAGKAATGEALVRGGCDKLIFIGSTTVGRAVMRTAAESLTPLTLELGGKDPFIICDDVDPEKVAQVAMRAAFQSCGQNCVAAERFIVHEAIHDKFVQVCGSLATHLRQGPPLGAPFATGHIALHLAVFLLVPL